MSGNLIVSYQQACKQTQEIYEDIAATLNIKDLELIPNWAKCIGAHPEKLQAKWRLVKSGVFDNSLSPILRELILVCISRSVNSPYCEARHSYELMRATNLGYEEIVNIIEGSTHAIIPARYYIALNAVKAVLRGDCETCSEQLEGLKEEGFEAEETLEIMELMSAGIYINFYTKCLNVPIDKEIQAFLEKNAQQLIY